MLFEVHVVPRAEYDQHLSELKAAGDVGAPVGAKEADTIAGLNEGTNEDEDVQDGAGN
jgi:cytochrome c oxidase subunit 2